MDSPLIRVGVTGDSNAQNFPVRRAPPKYMAINLPTSPQLSQMIESNLFKQITTTYRTLDAIIIFAGGNDIDSTKSHTLSKLIDAFTDTIILAHKQNIPTFIIPITPRSTPRHKTEHEFYNLAKHTMIRLIHNIQLLNLTYKPIIDISTLTLTLTDGIHPNKASYEAIARLTFRHISQELFYLEQNNSILRNPTAALLPTPTPPLHNTLARHHNLQHRQQAAAPH